MRLINEERMSKVIKRYKNINSKFPWLSTFQPIDNCKLLWSNRNIRYYTSKGDSTIMTVKFPKEKFEGRIITNEHLVINEKRIPIRTLWDTGSTYSVCSKRYFDLLESVGRQEQIGTIDGFVSSDIAKANIEITDTIFNTEVCCNNDLESMEIDFIIGMDIISEGKFTFASTVSEFIFTFEFIE